ncbi:MAG: hypothetical protein ACOYMP_11565 [Nodosilinea sp.]
MADGPKFMQWTDLSILTKVAYTNAPYIADFTRVKCDMITPPAPPYQGEVQRETLTASRWGVGLSNWVFHSIENRYSTVHSSNMNGLYFYLFPVQEQIKVKLRRVKAEEFKT